MKKALLFSIALCGAASGFAQLTQGDIAPDFTVTPMNAGLVPFHLYSELDAGRPVILDVSATWCGPCWNYHNSGKLEQLYDAYGPEGTNELNVIWVEGDGATADATMYDGAGSIGNWLIPAAGDTVPFPMANPAASTANAINNDYEISAFPTLYVICPNRSVSTFAQNLSVAQIYAKAMACPVASQPVDVAAFSYSGGSISCGDLPVSAKIQNMGTGNLTSATVVAKKGNTVLGTENWTGNLDTYGVANIDFGDLPFGTTAGNLTIEVTTTSDGDAGNATVTKAITVSQDKNDDKFDVKVKLDGYASEVYFKLSSSTGTTVLAKQYASGDNNKTYSYPVDLDVNECYYMNVTDAYGDGLLSGGYVKIATKAGVDIFVANGTYSEKNYGFTPKAETVENSSIEENAVTGELFSVYPNPATDVLNTSLTLTDAEMVNFRIVNAQGQTVMLQNAQMTAGTSIKNFDVSNLAAGVYTLQITSGGQVSAKAFIKQ